MNETTTSKPKTANELKQSASATLYTMIEDKVSGASVLLAECVPAIIDELMKATASAALEETAQKVSVCLKLDFEAQPDGTIEVSGGVQTARSIKRSFDLEGETIDPRQVPLNLAPKP